MVQISEDVSRLRTELAVDGPLFDIGPSTFSLAEEASATAHSAFNAVVDYVAHHVGPTRDARWVHSRPKPGGSALAELHIQAHRPWRVIFAIVGYTKLMKLTPEVAIVAVANMTNALHFAGAILARLEGESRVGLLLPEIALQTTVNAADMSRRGRLYTIGANGCYAFTDARAEDLVCGAFEFFARNVGPLNDPLVWSYTMGSSEFLALDAGPVVSGSTERGQCNLTFHICNTMEVPAMVTSEELFHVVDWFDVFGLVGHACRCAGASYVRARPTESDWCALLIKVM